MGIVIACVCKTFCLRSVLFWGMIGLDPSVQIKLHFKILFICIAFATLKYLWDVKNSVCSTIPHSTWLSTYVDSYMHTDRVTPYTAKQSSCIFWWNQGSASRRLIDWHWILQAAIGLPTFYIPTFGNPRKLYNSFISHYFFRLPTTG